MQFHGQAIANAFLADGHVLAKARSNFFWSSIRMPQSGEKNTSFGTYKSKCCGFEIVIVERATFPDCPKHSHLPNEWAAVIETNELISLTYKGSNILSTGRYKDEIFQRFFDGAMESKGLRQ